MQRQATTGDLEQFRGEYFKPSLHAREIKPARRPYQHFMHVFFLHDGRSHADFDSEGHDLDKHSVLMTPSLCELTITLAPGAEAYLIGISRELLLDVIGNKAESVLLRIFTERPAIIAGSVMTPALVSEMAFLMKGALKEGASSGHGSQMAIAAYMRLIVMTLWRTGDWEAPAASGHGLDIASLQRFRQLVELHFRQRRPISFYAGQLGISHDRLHAICTRTLGRSPTALLHQRIVQEANLRLERSGSPIQEIAHQLGFTDQTYFSHFYKRATGRSPVEYRKQFQANGSHAEPSSPSEYADWP